MTSVQPQQFTGGIGRKTIHLPSLDETRRRANILSRGATPGTLAMGSKGEPLGCHSDTRQSKVRSLQLSGVIYNRTKIDAGSIGGMKEAGPITLASNHNNAILVDLSGYGLESVLGLYFNPLPFALPSFAADFTLTSFHPEKLNTHGAVAIHAGPGKPMPSLPMAIPDISSIHRVAALRPVKIQISSVNSALVEYAVGNVMGPDQTRFAAAKEVEHADLDVLPGSCSCWS